MYHYGNKEHYENQSLVEEGLGSYAKAKGKSVISATIGTKLKPIDTSIERKISGAAAKAVELVRFGKGKLNSLIEIEKHLIKLFIDKNARA